VNLIAVGYATD